MNRRNFCMSVSALALSSIIPTTAAALPEKINGQVVGNEFHWQRIGVDPFGDQDLAIVLDLLGIPQKYRATILNRVQIAPGVYTEPDARDVIQSEYRYDAMVSGGINPGSVPWVTTNIRPFPDAWENWERQLDIWYFNFEEDRTYFWLARAHGCSNWLVIVIDGTPINCRCDQSVDVCI